MPLPITGALRVAVVWRTATPRSFAVAQDVPVPSGVPAALSFALSPPPAVAMMVPSNLGDGGAGGCGGSRPDRGRPRPSTEV